MSGSRKDALLMALEAEVGGTTGTWAPCSPTMSWDGRRTRACRACRRSASCPPSTSWRSPISLLLRGLDEVGNKAFAEWVIEADHTGPLVSVTTPCVEATGRHVQLAGATVADFRDGRIRSYRTYFDDSR